MKHISWSDSQCISPDTNTLKCFKMLVLSENCVKVQSGTRPISRKYLLQVYLAKDVLGNTSKLYGTA